MVPALSFSKCTLEPLDNHPHCTEKKIKAQTQEGVSLWQHSPPRQTRVQTHSRKQRPAPPPGQPEARERGEREGPEPQGKDSPDQVARFHLQGIGVVFPGLLVGEGES